MSRFSLNPDNRSAASHPWGNARKSASGEDTEAREEAEDEAVEEGAEEAPSAADQRRLDALQAKLQELEASQRQADLEKANRFTRLKREAVASGDTETYDRLDREEKQFYAGMAQRQQPQPSQQDAAITQRWMEQNRWMQNHYLAGQAQAIAQRFADKGVVGAEQLRRVEREMRERFGDMIAEYEHGKPGRPRSGGKRDWDSIPAADRKLLTDQYFKSRGVAHLPDTPAMRARVAKSYWDSNRPEE